MTLSTAIRLDAPMMLHASTAEDLMVPNPISIRADAGVTEAITMFTEKGITAAPVMDEAGRPIGVISRSDLLIHQCEHEKQRSGHHDYFDAPKFREEDSSARLRTPTTVAELMTPAVFAVSPDTPVNRVICDMVGLHVHRLFVVDEDGILVGVISTMDILKHLKRDA